MRPDITDKEFIRFSIETVSEDEIEKYKAKVIHGREAEFLKMFSKNDIIRLLTKSVYWKWYADKLCLYLYEEKTKELLDEMDKLVEKRTELSNKLAHVKSEDYKDTLKYVTAFNKVLGEIDKVDKAIDNNSKEFDKIDKMFNKGM